MQTKLLLACLLFGVALSSLFTFVTLFKEVIMARDIVKGLVESKSNKISSFVDNIPQDVLSTLETDEQQAGQFVCQILHGNIPGIIDDLATDVWDEIKDDWSAITEFIEALPTLAPEILYDIIQDGEDVISVVEEIFTNPGGALTLVENDVKTVISDIESVAEGFWNGLTCFFKNCATSTTATVDPAATLSSSCNAILAAATTTYRATSTTSTYTPAQTIHVTTTAVPKTSTPSTTKSSTTSTTKSTTTYTASASTTLAAQASSQSSVSPTTQATFQQQTGSSGGKAEMSIQRAWFALSVCFLAAVFVL